MTAQWVLISLTMDDFLRIMKEFLKLKIDRTNSDGPMIIHHILSIVKSMTHSGISNIKINLGNMKMKYFDNDVNLEKKQVKGWMEEI